MQKYTLSYCDIRIMCIKQCVLIFNIKIKVKLCIDDVYLALSVRCQHIVNGTLCFIMFRIIVIIQTSICKLQYMYIITLALANHY